jgi:hypothetical protein
MQQESRVAILADCKCHRQSRCAIVHFDDFQMASRRRIASHRIMSSESETSFAVESLHLGQRKRPGKWLCASKAAVAAAAEVSDLTRSRTR